MHSTLKTLLVSGLLLGLGLAGSVAAEAGNPYDGPDGTASMHGDSEASDTTPFAGPGAKADAAQLVTPGGVCPTIVAGKDGIPQALCTGYLDRAPFVVLLDPEDGSVLDTLKLTKGTLLGGVYAYVDHRDRLVTVDGTGAVLLVRHRRNGDSWELAVQRSLPLGPAFTKACGAPGCDAPTSVAPGYDGRIWFATGKGRAGYVHPRAGVVRLRSLGKGEIVANSIATAKSGVAITTDHATVLVKGGRSGRIRLLWRKSYDRGSARKPGQLSHGSGATPTFFGPKTGHEYVAYTDNARPRERLIVRRAATGAKVCSVPLFSSDNSGTENSPVAWGRHVYVASSYGYPYPAVPDGAGTAEPASATFQGGFQRIDVTKKGCRTAWRNRVRSAAVPRLSRAEKVIYTVTRSAASVYELVRLSPRTGAVLSRQRLGFGPLYDSLQMVGVIMPDGTLYQGTLGGLLIVRPGAAG